MSCRELAELISDHLEGRLGLVDRVRFQLHLGMCRDCRAYLKQMRGMVRALGALPAEPPPAHVQEELLTRFRDFHRTSKS